MPKRDAVVALRQMREHADLAVQGAARRSRKELEEDVFFRFGLIHLVEIVGEAARRVPQVFQTRFHTIPWADIIGMRNKLTHGYDQVDLALLWDVVKIDLPGLIKGLDSILQAVAKESQ